MNAPAPPRPARPLPLVGAGDVAFLPRGVRLADDRVRAMRVLQAPERAMRLDAVGDAILTALDGQRSIGAIAADLSARYAAPVAQIEADMIDFLSALVERRMVFVRGRD